MSTMQEQLRTLLNGATDAGTRVFPMVAQDTTGPYIVYQRIAAVPETFLDGDVGLIQTRMQIDVYVPMAAATINSYARADAIARQVKALMAGWTFKNVLVLEQDLYDPDVKIGRVSLDYSISHPTNT
jgi:hypothetical protein